MNSDAILDQADLIRGVFSYTARFSGRTFVLHLDTSDFDDEPLALLVNDLALLQRAGIRVVLVPGARLRIDEVLRRYGIEWKRHLGIRIAGAEAIPFIKMAAFDATNRLMTLLAANDTNAVVGNWVRARGIGVIDGVDFEHSGMVEKIQLDLLKKTLEQGIIPIFPCIGWGSSGKPYNISSRELAYRIATSLRASKLFFVTNGVRLLADAFSVGRDVPIGSDGRISRMSVTEAEAFLRENTTAGGGGMEFYDRPSGYFDDHRSDQLEMVRLAIGASRTGVDRVHIVDGRMRGVVLAEVFSDIGVGTMIHANQYESIRPLRPAEAPEVYRLMTPLVERGVLVPRSEEDIGRRSEDYVVHETDGRLHGCGALHEYPGGVGEIAAIAVDSAYEHLGIGRRIVLYLVDEARRRGYSSVFVLTTRTTDWFESIGFERATVADLPADKRSRYDTERNSIILSLKL